MELQNYISENSDYDKTLKERGFIVKNFNKYDLKLIKYPYDRNVDTNTFERYLKGCIVDTKTNKVVMIPPIKSDNLINYNMCVNGAVIQGYKQKYVLILKNENHSKILFFILGRIKQMF